MMARLELAQDPPDGIDMTAADGPVVEGFAQGRDGVDGPGPVQDPVGVPGRGAGRFGHEP